MPTVRASGVHEDIFRCSCLHPGIFWWPVLMTPGSPGKDCTRNQESINRFLIWAYQHSLTLLLLFLWLLRFCCARCGSPLTYIPVSRLGKEVMPPLNEDPPLHANAVPGNVPVTEATTILTDPGSLPSAEVSRVESVFGKAAKLTTPTDPVANVLFRDGSALKAARTTGDQEYLGEADRPK